MPKGKDVNIHKTESIEFLSNWLKKRKPILKENIHSSKYFSDYRTTTDGEVDEELNKQINNAKSFKWVELFPNSQIQKLTKEGIFKNEDEARDIVFYPGFGEIFGTSNNSRKLVGLRFPDGVGNVREFTAIHEATHSLNAEPQREKIKSILSNIRYKNKDLDRNYTYDEDEIYSRLMEFRKFYKLNPEKKVTPEDLKKLRDYKLKYINRARYINRETGEPTDEQDYIDERVGMPNSELIHNPQYDIRNNLNILELFNNDEDVLKLLNEVAINSESKQSKINRLKYAKRGTKFNKPNK